MTDRLYISIEGELARVDKVLEEKLKSNISMIDSISRFVTKNGGKRIRPAVFLLATHVSGAAGVDFTEYAAAIEMLHAASLMHDDVVDDASIRRGAHTVRASWGNQTSVLMGDFLWSRALGIIIENGRDEILKIVSQTVGEMIEGEIFEVSKQNNLNMTPENYMEIIRGKTAALFSMAAKLGAVLAGVSKTFEDTLSEYGYRLGEAFQLSDDALDYVADEHRFGKSAGQDLREGKLTYPLIVALKDASDAEKSVVRDAIVASRVTNEQFESVAEIIKRHRGIEETLTLAQEVSDKAKACLDVFKPSIERDALIGLADYVVSRKE